MNKLTSSTNSKSSWISENPKKTGLILFIIISMISLFLADRLLNYIVPIESKNKQTITRAIALREHHPNLDKEILADNAYLSRTDNLITRNFQFRTDRNGYILPRNNYEKPDVKIVFIGGSTTECMYVTENNRFPYLSGQLIEEKTNKLINSFNAGASGNNAIHSIDLFLNKIIPVKPDVIVFMHAINDYATLAYDHTYWPVETPRSEIITINDYFPRRPPETLLWHLKGIFHVLYPNIYNRLHDLKKKVLHSPESAKHWDEWVDRRHKIKDRDFNFMQKEFQWAMQLMVTASKTHNILPIIMTQANRFKNNPDDFVLKSLDPLLSGGITYETFKVEYDTFNEIAREIAKDNNIPLIDLAKLVPQEKEYMYDVLHFNDTGSIFVANIISECLTNLINHPDTYKLTRNE